MFDQMTVTKTVAAFCGALLILMLSNWAASSLFSVGGGHGEEHAAYVIDTGAEEAGAAAASDEPPFEEVFATPRWQRLADEGANLQRPLWASTGVKNPDYPDTLYVTDLVAPSTVNTMPEKTLDAVIDHGEVTGDEVTGRYAEAQQVLDDLDRLGISYTDVTEQLEREGVEKFEQAWDELLEGVSAELQKAVTAR